MVQRKKPISKAKNSNHTKKKSSMSKKSQTKEPVWLGEYRSFVDFEMKVVTHSFLENFAKHMLDEARNNEDYLTVEDLFVHLGIPERTYYEWVERFDFFKEAHNQAVRLIGLKREKGGLKRKLDSGIVNMSMHHYSPRWKQSIEWRSSLKEKEKGTGAQNITVVMDRFDDSPMVPEKTPEQVAARKPEKPLSKYE